jgi:taurine dioxygenase
MHVRRLTGSLGAEIDGVRLETIDDHEFKELHDALLTHQVVVLPGQHLSEDGHRALAQRFGTPSVFPVSKHLGGTEYLGHIKDSPESPPDADGWHTDVTWIAEPPAYAVLNAKVIPAQGGDTMWSSLFAAYDALSPVMQRLCDQLTVRHHAGADFRERVARTVGDETADRIVCEFPPVEHPLVRTHPVTGRRALWVAGRFMDQVVGMHRDESDALLGFLGRHIENPNFCVRWRWTPGDLAIWDEASTNHRALSDHYPAHRVMRRCTVDGDRPYFTLHEGGQD